MSRIGKRAVLRVIITIFLALVPGAWAAGGYKTLYAFKDGQDGAYPQAGLILDADGNLYGTALQGGVYGYGTVFKLSAGPGGGWKETVLHSFNSNGHDGVSSVAGLIFDKEGNLYGTTYYGGNGPCTSGQFPGCGTVFKLAPLGGGKWQETVIYNFMAGSDGAFPASSLTLDAAGNLYGTTASGGLGPCTFGGYVGCGTVFDLVPSTGGWTETVLHSFGGGTDGQFLDGGVVMDSTGNVYGTTEQGGNSSCYHNYGCGTIFKLALSNGVWTKTTLYTFSGSPDGGWPVGNLVFDGAGSLYGVTLEGGGQGVGTAFELMSVSGNWTETVLHRFCSRMNCDDGALPFAGLIFDQAGNLYGTTGFGGRGGYGVVFKLTADLGGGWDETVLHYFIDRPGADPIGGVIFDPAGNLYGTTEGVPGTTSGSVFEIAP
jgi:uncharacterized repeat protein (TIGR03803 family)